METQIKKPSVTQTTLKENQIKIGKAHISTIEGTYGTYHIEAPKYKYYVDTTLPKTPPKLPEHHLNHQILRLSMRWGFCNEYTSIADLSLEEIQRIKSLIQTEGFYKERGGYSNKQWFDTLNTEIKYRNKKADILAKKFIQVCSCNKRNGLFDLLNSNKDIFVSELV